MCGASRDAGSNLPGRESPPLKDPSQFRLVGKEGAVKKLDVPAKTNGAAQFTIDIREPDRLTVVVARPTRFNAKIASVDDIDARKSPGVIDVNPCPSGVAVCAPGCCP